MKNKRWIMLVALIVWVAASFSVIPAPALAADTVTITETTISQPSTGIKGVKRVTFTFSSDDGTIARSASFVSSRHMGWLIKFHYIPDGANTPDAAADIQLYPELATGINLLYGSCDNVGATETVDTPLTSANGTMVFIDSPLYFYAGSLGAGTNGGILHVWIMTP